jgi:hypothetical protein
VDCHEKSRLRLLMQIWPMICLDLSPFADLTKCIRFRCEGSRHLICPSVPFQIGQNEADKDKIGARVKTQFISCDIGNLSAVGLRTGLWV